ncbi:MAG TPA: hypothetical protein VGS80_15635, partial [Ktedonobacterales bacterium]|nr:hypothetical protein [Ktedonobacterales bacterium]
RRTGAEFTSSIGCGAGSALAPRPAPSAARRLGAGDGGDALRRPQPLRHRAMGPRTTGGRGAHAGLYAPADTRCGHAATLHRVFKALAVEVFETVLAQWAPVVRGGRGEALALDGKALRGIHGEQLPGVRLVAAYDVQTGLVLAQRGVRHKTVPAALAEEDALAEEKAQAELSVAPDLLRQVPLQNRLVTGGCALLPARAVGTDPAGPRPLPVRDQAQATRALGGGGAAL